MKNLKSKLLTPLRAGVIATSLLLPMKNLSAQDTTNVKQNAEQYFRIGVPVRSFNNSGLKNVIGDFGGIEACYGKSIDNNFEIGFNTVRMWKKLEDESISNSEFGGFLDYNLEDFYFGAGPKIIILSDDHNSYTALGLSARIGYNIKITNNLYFGAEYNYTNAKTEVSDENEDIGSSGVSIYLKLDY